MVCAHKFSSIESQTFMYLNILCRIWDLLQHRRIFQRATLLVISCTLNHKNYNAKYVVHLYFENESKWVITYISRIRMATSTRFWYFYGSNSSRTCDGIIYTFACTNVGVTKLFWTCHSIFLPCKHDNFWSKWWRISII